MCAFCTFTLLILLVWSCLGYFKPWSLFGNSISFWAMTIVWKIRSWWLEIIFCLLWLIWCMFYCLIFRNDLIRGHSYYSSIYFYFPEIPNSIANKSRCFSQLENSLVVSLHKWIYIYFIDVYTVEPFSVGGPLSSTIFGFWIYRIKGTYCAFRIQIPEFQIIQILPSYRLSLEIEKSAESQESDLSKIFSKF